MWPIDNLKYIRLHNILQQTSNFLDQRIKSLKVVVPPIIFRYGETDENHIREHLRSDTNIMAACQYNSYHP